jgi:hypothetical protein
VILFIFLTGIPPLRQPSPVDPRFQHIAAVRESTGEGRRGKGRREGKEGETEKGREREGEKGRAGKEGSQDRH